MPRSPGHSSNKQSTTARRTLPLSRAKLLPMPGSRLLAGLAGARPAPSTRPRRSTRRHSGRGCATTGVANCPAPAKLSPHGWPRSRHGRRKATPACPMPLAPPRQRAPAEDRHRSDTSKNGSRCWPVNSEPSKHAAISSECAPSTRSAPLATPSRELPWRAPRPTNSAASPSGTQPAASKRNAQSRSRCGSGQRSARGSLTRSSVSGLVTHHAGTGLLGGCSESVQDQCADACASSPPGTVASEASLMRWYCSWLSRTRAAPRFSSR